MDPDGATLPRLTGAHSGIPTRRRLPTAAVVTAVVVVVLARSLRRVVVAGGSMAPTLLEGDRLLAVASPRGRVRAMPGDLVVLPDPRTAGRVLVKRVAAVDPAAGTVEVRGDAADASTDSRTFGSVPAGSLMGRVVYRYGPAGRSGPLRRPTEYHQG
jgi:nickel-type superoxide dismutase maturation protease